jgi:hypothetical protein
MYTKGWKTALSVAFVAIVAIAAFATHDGTTIEGKITVVNPASNRFTIDTPSGVMTFDLDSSTMVMRGNETKTVNDLRIGDKVRVSYDGSGATKVASHVDVLVLVPGDDVAMNQPTNPPSTTHPYNNEPDAPPSSDLDYDRDTASNPDYRDELPATASPLPLIGLSGVLLIGLALAVRFGRSLIG